MNSQLLLKLIAIQFKALFLGKQKKLKKWTIVMAVIGILYAIVVIFVLFASIFFLLNTAFVPVGLRWLYYAFVALIATSFGVIGTVYALYTQLFLSRDNSILMPLPIPKWMILTSRLSSSYLALLGIEGLFVALGVGIDFYDFGFDIVRFIFAVLALIFLPMIAMTISSVLALIFSLLMRLAGRFQRFLAVALYLGGFMLYFWGVNSLNSGLVISMSQSVQALRSIFQGPFIVLMWFGQWVDGQWLSALLFIFTSLVVMAVLIALLSTQLGKNIKEVKRANGPRGVRLAQKSILTWLIRKEWALLTSQAMLMVNACSPILMSVLILFLWQDKMPSFVLPLLLFTPAMMSSYTSGSLSLERNRLWIVKSLPIDTKTLFMAKLLTGLMISGLGWLIIFVFILFKGVLFDQTFIMSVFISLLMLMLEQLTGLLANVWKPRFDFMNDAAALKQGGATFIQVFGSLGFVAAFMGLLATGALSPQALLYVALGVILLLLVLTWKVLMTWGIKRYEDLTC